MKDPKLLVSEGGTDFERRWLSAARAEEPPAEVVARIEQALGLGTGAPAAPAPAASAAKSGLSALRIAGLSALGVGGTVVGLMLLLSRPAPRTLPATAPATELPPAPE